MTEFKTGNIIAEHAEAVVCTVNCVGVMGRGIALQFKKAFPENFKAYAAECKKRNVRIGKMFVFVTGRLGNPRYIVNFPTKRHWREGSRICDIDVGLEDLVKVIRARNIQSIAIPPLGCGLGGLEWDEVRPRIVKALDGVANLQVTIFEPLDRPEPSQVIHDHLVPRMTAGRAALVGLIHQYRRVLLDPFITLFEVHKLMYFLQVAGEPLRLRYAKGHYGPYAENLRHVLDKIEGHFITGYSGCGDAPGESLELIPDAVDQAHCVLKAYADTEKRFDRVVDLVSGFESSFGLELLATVHWVLKNEMPKSHDDVILCTHAWNERKKLFSPRDILLAADVLVQKRWIESLILKGGPVTLDANAPG